MSVNDNLRDQYVRHIIAVQRFFEFADAQTQREFRRSAERLNDILDDSSLSQRTKTSRANAELTALYGIVRRVTRGGISNLAGLEANFQRNALQQAIGKWYRVKKGGDGAKTRTPLSPTRSDITGRRGVDDYIDGIERRHRTMVSRAVRSGSDPGFTKAARDVRAVQRTGFTNTQTSAALSMIENNADVLNGYQWISTLDTRTSPICQSRDGEFFEIGSGIRPPAHFNCRSTIVPVVKSYEELGVPGKTRIPERRRASFNGQVSASLTFGQWLKGQPFSVQSEVLGGAARAQLFAQGLLRVNQFRDLDGNPYTFSRLSKQVADTELPFTTDAFGDLNADQITLPRINKFSDVFSKANYNTFLASIVQSSRIKSSSGSWTKANTFATISYNRAFRDAVTNNDWDMVNFDAFYDERQGRSILNIFNIADPFRLREELRLIGNDRKAGRITEGDRKDLLRLRRGLGNNGLQDDQIAAALQFTRQNLVRQRQAAKGELVRGRVPKPYDPEQSDINKYIFGGLQSSARNVLNDIGDGTRAQRARDDLITVNPVNADDAINRPASVRRTLNTQTSQINRAVRMSGLVDDVPDIVPDELLASGKSATQIAQDLAQEAAYQIGSPIQYAILNIGRAAFRGSRIDVPDDVAVEVGKRALRFISEKQVGGRNLLGTSVQQKPLRAWDREGLSDVFYDSRFSAANFRYLDSDSPAFLNYKQARDNVDTLKSYPSLSPTRIEVGRSDSDTFTSGALRAANTPETSRADVDAINNVNSVGSRANQEMADAFEWLINNDLGVRFKGSTEYGFASVFKSIEVLRTIGNRVFYTPFLLGQQRRQFATRGFQTNQGPEYQKALQLLENGFEVSDEAWDLFTAKIGEDLKLTRGNTLEAYRLGGQRNLDRLEGIWEAVVARDTNLFSRRLAAFENAVESDSGASLDTVLMLRYAQEVYNYRLHFRNNTDQPYRSRFVDGNDLSANQAQNHGIFLRNQELMEATNVSGRADVKRDPYVRIGEVIKELAGSDTKLSDLARESLQGISADKFRKIVKSPIFTTGYNITDFGQRRQVADAIRDAFGEDSDIYQLFKRVSNNEFAEDGVRFQQLIVDAIRAELPGLTVVPDFLTRVSRTVGDRDFQWRSPEGTDNVIAQVYRTEQRELEFEVDGQTYTVGSRFDIDEIDVRSRNTSLAANFTQYWDGYTQRRFQQIIYERYGIRVKGVHDQFDLPIGIRPDVPEIINEIFQEIWDIDPLRNLLDGLRDAGALTRAEHRQLIQELEEIQGDARPSPTTFGAF